MITLRNLTLRRGTKIVLDDANVTLQPGERIGLVGANGAGKSSLFALLAGRLQADKGDAEMPPTWRLSEVAQHLPETEQGATDFVLDGDLTLLKAREQLAAAEAAHDGLKMAEAHAALQDAGSFDARPRAQSLLLGLGFKVDQLDAPVNSFSGGWRMRLQLARTLINPAELMLLDEPTNHLDLDALVWLEGWLSRYPGTLIVISHDREFLDAITRVTLHLEHAKLTRWGANYTGFETLRAQAQELQQASFEKQQDRIKHLQSFIDRFKAKASKAKQAQSRVKALERMEKLAPVLAAADFAFEFREPANLPNPMLALSDLACGYGATAIVRKIDRTVLAGQRIGILGANGQGKSTVVKTIARTMPPLAGTITEGKGLTIGYFAQQELDVLRPDEGPLAHMVRLAKEVSPQAREQELRDFLGQFRFTGDMVSQEVGSLSGGEKARLVLAMLVWQRPNLLLLDEPTNHLDLATREALSIALNEFEGTVMLVSHDRALLRAVCDEFWLVGRGGVAPFDGDLDDYQQYLLDEARQTRERLRAATDREPAAEAINVVASSDLFPLGMVEKSSKPTVSAPVGAADARERRRLDAQRRQGLAQQSRPLRKQLLACEQALEQLNAEKSLLEGRLSSPIPPHELAQAGRRLKLLQTELDEIEDRWLELSGQLEVLAGGAAED